MAFEDTETNHYDFEPVFSRLRVTKAILFVVGIALLLLSYHLETLQDLKAKNFPVWPYWYLFLFTAVSWGITWIAVDSQTYGKIYDLFHLHPTDADRKQWPVCLPVRSASMWAYVLIVVCALLDVADGTTRSGSPQFILSSLLGFSVLLLILFLPFIFIDASAAARILTLGIGGLLVAVGIPVVLLITWIIY